jgi:hypothetical protein
MEGLGQALGRLGQAIQNLPARSAEKAYQAAKSTLSFFNADYLDLNDFLYWFEKKDPDAFRAGALRESAHAVREQLQKSVLLNKVTSEFDRASGLSIWLPTYPWTLDAYRAKYQLLKFEENHGWLAAIEKIFSGKPQNP